LQNPKPQTKTPNLKPLDPKEQTSGPELLAAHLMCILDLGLPIGGGEERRGGEEEGKKKEERKNSDMST